MFGGQSAEHEISVFSSRNVIAISMYPKLWAASGMPPRELVARLIELALERHAVRGSLRTLPSLCAARETSSRSPIEAFTGKPAQTPLAT